MDDFKTWYEKKHGEPFPAEPQEPAGVVWQRLADSFAEWSREWMLEMAKLIQPPQMIIPTNLPDPGTLSPGRVYTQDARKKAHHILIYDEAVDVSEEEFSAAVEDAALHGAGFLRITPDGRAERVAPEDWQAEGAE